MDYICVLTEFLSILSYKIEKAKEVVHAGKNISALQEEMESLRKQLVKNQAMHARAMKEREGAAAAKIDSLKKSVAEQAELLWAQEHEAESSLKVHA
jgi:predicted  nucleic acid-binding Zn-ribbon protein